MQQIESKPERHMRVSANPLVRSSPQSDKGAAAKVHLRTSALVNTDAFKSPRHTLMDRTVP